MRMMISAILRMRKMMRIIGMSRGDVYVCMCVHISWDQKKSIYNMLLFLKYPFVKEQYYD